MAFEFDPEKSLSNLHKHGVDFTQIQALWRDPKRIIVPARSTTEPRFAIIGEIEGRIWTSIFTLREERVRIVSARRSRDEERKGYYQR
jgi:hypothetical protein